MTLGTLLSQRLAAAKLVLAILLASFVSVGWTEEAPPEPAIEINAEALLKGAPPESLEDLKAIERHIQSLAKMVMPATVGVRVGQAQGSGVIVSADGYVLTAAHVNGSPGKNVTFIFPDGSTKKGKTLGVNRGVDSGMMKITDEGEYPYLPIGSSGDLRRGDWVMATGHPGGYERGRTPPVRFGRVLSTRSTVIMTDCTLVGGDSGGPLFNMKGEVIGIHSRIGGPLTANMHVPADSYIATWDRLADSEQWGGSSSNGPYIGVQGDPEAKDAKIVGVSPGSPAEKAGIKGGDSIVEFAGKKVDSFPTLGAAVRDNKVGDKVDVVVMRDGKRVKLRLTIGKRAG